MMKTILSLIKNSINFLTNIFEGYKVKIILILILFLFFILLFNKVRINKLKGEITNIKIENKEVVSILTNSIVENSKVANDTIKHYKAISKNLDDGIEELDIINKKLNNDIKALNIKNKHLEAAYYQQLEINAKFESESTIIFVGDTVNVSNLEFTQYDTAYLKDNDENTVLQLYRKYKYPDDVPYYDINYYPELSTIIAKEKDGKWKFRNIWDWRDRYYSVYIVSNDTIMKPRNIRYYINKDK